MVVSLALTRRPASIILSVEKVNADEDAQGY